jgi:hypothetical protein
MTLAFVLNRDKKVAPQNSTTPKETILQSTFHFEDICIETKLKDNRIMIISADAFGLTPVNMKNKTKFEKTTLYDNKSTYIYCSAIRSLKDDKNIIGGIATIFDSSLQFYTMLEEILPKDAYGDKQKGA